MKQTSLNSAKREKNDEFYTRREDIEKELAYYQDRFQGKTVLLNCDDPYESEFFKYFANLFDFLGLRKLISISYANSPIAGSQLRPENVAGLIGVDVPPAAYKVEITEVSDVTGDGAVGLDDVGMLMRSDVNTVTPLVGDGDFRSEEVMSLLREADVIVTNPPFSQFREFLAQLIENEKDFLIIGNMNAVTYREVWPLVEGDKMWLGVTRVGTGQMWFRVADDAPEKKGQREEDGVRYQTIGSSAWFTNLENLRRNEEIPLYCRYEDDPDKYPKYDNYDAVEVSKVKEIPVDYDGVMGVPITFLGKHNPGQFEIVGASESEGRGFSNGLWNPSSGVSQAMVNGTKKFKRIFIRHIRQSTQRSINGHS